MKSSCPSTDQKIAKSASYIYRDESIFVRLLALARTYICPMQPLLVEVPQNATVLDIGCGNGLFLSLLSISDKIANSVGVDYNSKVVKNAQRIVSKLLAEKHDMLSVNFYLAKNPSNWPNNLFSFVSMIDVLHHISSEAQQDFFIAATQRVCPGGLLLYKDMCMRPLWRALGNRLHDLILAKQVIHYVPIDIIKKWAHSCGLQLEKEAYYSRFIYGHEKLVFKRKL